MASIIRLANVEKTYYISNTVKQQVLRGINASFSQGEMVGILGESGCGKSTLIHILGGLDTNYTGSVIIKGKFIRDFSESEMDDYRKQKIGMIFQNYNLIAHMNVFENIEIALEMSNVSYDKRKDRVKDLLKLVGMFEHKEKYPNQLSGGQKQRIAIARALANNPSILLADEPTGALDKESTEGILKLLKEIALSGKLVLVVTHSQRVAEECTRVITLEDGVIVQDIQQKELKKQEYKIFKEEKPKSIQRKSLFKIATRNLLASKKRSIFVSLGISIGIGAVILILCLSRGLSNYVKDVYGSDETALHLTAKGNTLSSDDILKVEQVDGVSSITSSYNIVNTQYTYLDQSGTINFMTGYYISYQPNLLYGSYPKNSNEMIINTKLAQELSEEGIISSIGTSLSFSYFNVNYVIKITGIFEDLAATSSRNSCLINQETLDNITEKKNILFIKVKDITYLESVNTALSKLEYTVYQEDNSSDTVLEYIDLGTHVLTGVALLSMLVSAIMILIVEYISVIERTQEIGILRAIGARKKDVRRMFIYESSQLGLLGGIFGVVISLVIASITNIVCYIKLGSLFISYFVPYYLLGILLSMLVSILAGVAPSFKASDLDPVDALRFE